MFHIRKTHCQKWYGGHQPAAAEISEMLELVFTEKQFVSYFTLTPLSYAFTINFLASLCSITFTFLTLLYHFF